MDSDNDADFESLDDDSDQDNDFSLKTTEFKEKCCVSDELLPEVNSNELHDSSKSKSAGEDTPHSLEQVQSKTVEESGDGDHNDIKDKSMHQEIKRVPLRREKKIQEKIQAMAEKNLVEKEITNSNEGNKKDTVESQTSWNLGSWGSSFISTAASSVSLLTNQMSQGIGTVLETVENSLMSPLSEERVESVNRKDSIETKDKSPAEAEPQDLMEGKSDSPDEESHSKSSFMSEIASWTKVFENTGTKVIVGGLDTLELIGKKSMDIIMKGDPGLRRKRTALSHGYQTLSEVLREAKAKDDAEPSNADTVYFSHSFDESGGLVHLEALEMLSKQCEADLEVYTGRHSGDVDVEQMMAEMKEIFNSVPSMDTTPDLQKDQNFETEFTQAVKGLNLKLSMNKLIEVQQKIDNYLTKCLNEQEKGIARDVEEIYRVSVSSLAQFTAKCVEIFHKIAEVILVPPHEERDPLNCASCITRLTTVLCSEVCIVSSRFCLCLDTTAKFHENSDKVVPKMTNVYFEASNSTAYIQDVHKLFSPVLMLMYFQATP